MLKKNIKYSGFDGEEYDEDFYFNLTETEIMEWELGEKGGMSELLQKIVKTKDVPKITQYFKEFILKSYGEKSADGKRFLKSPEITKAFTETDAYNKLFMELATDNTAAAAFINGITPNRPQDHLDKQAPQAKPVPSPTQQWPQIPPTDGNVQS